MKLALRLGSALAVLFLASPAAFAKSKLKGAGTTVTCTDGSSSKGGRGACRGHGGINKGSAAPANAAPAPAVPARSRASSGSSTKGTEGVDANAAGATAKCKDGSFSHSKGHSGACSRHGGVAQWLVGGK